MKKKFLFILTILIASLTTIAQEKRDTIRSIGRKQMINDRPAQKTLIDSLDLTKTQAKKFKELNREFRTRVKELRENTQLHAADRKERSRELLHKRNQELQKILTPEQLEQYRRMIKEQRENKTDDLMDDDSE
jgi:Spy/CpxP family protein refolding chaperone